MHEEKHAAIAQYLSESFTDCEIEQKPDFDRGAQSFKVHAPKATLLLKVGNEFLDDNDTAAILRLFKTWAIEEILAKEKELGVVVSQRGPELFKRG
jgi:hypothetical protein